MAGIEALALVAKASSRHSLYKGVTLYKPTTKWRAQISHGGRTVTLGDYTCEEEAARVFDRACICKYGNDATTNFPGEEYSAEWDELRASNIPALLVKFKEERQRSKATHRAPAAARQQAIGAAVAEAAVTAAARRRPPSPEATAAAAAAQPHRPVKIEPLQPPALLQVWDELALLQALQAPSSAAAAAAAAEPEAGATVLLPQQVPPQPTLPCVGTKRSTADDDVRSSAHSPTTGVVVGISSSHPAADCTALQPYQGDLRRHHHHHHHLKYQACAGLASPSFSTAAGSSSPDHALFSHPRGSQAATANPALSHPALSSRTAVPFSSSAAAAGTAAVAATAVAAATAPPTRRLVTTPSDDQQHHQHHQHKRSHQQQQYHSHQQQPPKQQQQRNHQQQHCQQQQHQQRQHLAYYLPDLAAGGGTAAGPITIARGPLPPPGPGRGSSPQRVSDGSSLGAPPPRRSFPGSSLGAPPPRQSFPGSFLGPPQPCRSLPRPSLLSLQESADIDNPALGAPAGGSVRYSSSLSPHHSAADSQHLMSPSSPEDVAAERNNDRATAAAYGGGTYVSNPPALASGSREYDMEESVAPHPAVKRPWVRMSPTLDLGSQQQQQRQQQQQLQQQPEDPNDQRQKRDYCEPAVKRQRSSSLSSVAAPGGRAGDPPRPTFAAVAHTDNSNDNGSNSCNDGNDGSSNAYGGSHAMELLRQMLLSELMRRMDDAADAVRQQKPQQQQQQLQQMQREEREETEEQERRRQERRQQQERQDKERRQHEWQLQQQEQERQKERQVAEEEKQRWRQVLASLGLRALSGSDAAALYARLVASAAAAAEDGHSGTYDDEDARGSGAATAAQLFQLRQQLGLQLPQRDQQRDQQVQQQVQQQLQLLLQQRRVSDDRARRDAGLLLLYGSPPPAAPAETLMPHRDASSGSGGGRTLQQVPQQALGTYAAGCLQGRLTTGQQPHGSSGPSLRQLLPPQKPHYTLELHRSAPLLVTTAEVGASADKHGGPADGGDHQHQSCQQQQHYNSLSAALRLSQSVLSELQGGVLGSYGSTSSSRYQFYQLPH